MYQVNDQKFSSYMAAVKAASEIRGEVFEVREDGEKVLRWFPAPAVSAKKMRMYEQRKAAYAAQEAQKAAK